MKLLLKISVIILATYLVIGCASISDLNNLQAQVDSLEHQVSNLSLHITRTKTISDEALLKTTKAENIANRAAQYAQETLSKISGSCATGYNKVTKLLVPACPHTTCHILNPTPNCLEPTHTCIDKAIASHQVECQTVITFPR